MRRPAIGGCISILVLGCVVALAIAIIWPSGVAGLRARLKSAGIGEDKASMKAAPEKAIAGDAFVALLRTGRPCDDAVTALNGVMAGGVEEPQFDKLRGVLADGREKCDAAAEQYRSMLIPATLPEGTVGEFGLAKSMCAEVMELRSEGMADLRQIVDRKMKLEEINKANEKFAASRTKTRVCLHNAIRALGYADVPMEEVQTLIDRARQ